MVTVKQVLIRLEPELVEFYDHLTVELDEYRTNIFEAILEEAQERIESKQLDMVTLMQAFHSDEEAKQETKKEWGPRQWPPFQRHAGNPAF